MKRQLETTTSEIFFADVPQEIWHEVLPHLPTETLFSTMLVSKTWQFISLQSITYLNANHIDKLNVKLLKRMENINRLLLNGPGIWHLSHDELSHFQNLTELDLSWSVTWKSCHLSKMTTLTHLYLGGNKLITDDSLKDLTNLEHLNISGNSKITDESLSRLTHLTYLNMKYNSDNITDNSLSELTNLKTLILGDNYFITNDCISRLTNLTELHIEYNKFISNDSISKLTNLTTLKDYGSFYRDC